MRGSLAGCLVTLSLSALPMVGLAGDSGSNGGSIAVDVAVLAGDGQPTTGLQAADFSVAVDGRDTEVLGVQAADAGSTEALPSFLVVVFDLPGLEQRRRRQLVEDVRPFLARAVADGARVLVAVTRPQFEIVHRFTRDPEELRQALDRVDDSDVNGDRLATARAAFRRSLMEEDLYVPGTSDELMIGLVGAPSTANVGGRQLLDTVTSLRDAERQRLHFSLGGLEAALHCTAGLTGTRSVIWLGGALSATPALALYEAYYQRYLPLANDLGLVAPEVWSPGAELASRFEHLTRVASTLRATVNVVNLNDVERERATTVGGARSGESSEVESGAVASSRPTSGVGFSQDSRMQEGGRTLAEATGGLYSVGRDVGSGLRDLELRRRAGYRLTLRAPTALDGRLLPVTVATRDGRSTVATNRLAALLSPDHELAERALAELLLAVNENEVGFVISRTDSADQDGGSVQTLRLEVPTALLRPRAGSADLVCNLRLAVVAADGSGNAGVPQLVPLEVLVPAARVGSSQRVATAFKIRVDAGSPALGIAVRDVGSGAVGSRVLELGQNS